MAMDGEVVDTNAREIGDLLSLIADHADDLREMARRASNSETEDDFDSLRDWLNARAPILTVVFCTAVHVSAAGRSISTVIAAAQLGASAVIRHRQEQRAKQGLVN